jgi:tetratricopeptide (TPR) repeat protein
MWIKRYGLLALLWILVYLHGAKSPTSFFFWSLGVTLFVIFRAKSILMNLPHLALRFEVGLFLMLIFSYIFSKNSSHSIYPTGQMLLFLILWIAIKADPESFPSSALWMRNFMLLGLADWVVTVYQWVHAGWTYTYGLFPVNPIFNATWLVGLGMALIGYATEQPSRKKAWKELSVGVLFCLTCGFLPARSAVVGMAIGFVYLFQKYLTGQRAIVLLGCLTVLVACIPTQVFYKRFRLDEKNPRLQIWSVALQGAKDHPWVGRGLGNFELAYQRHAFPFASDPIRYARTTEFAHNEFLQILVEAGLPAILLVLWGLSRVWRIPKANIESYKSSKVLLLVLLIVASYNMLWHLPLFVYLTLLCLAMIRNPLPKPVLSRNDSKRFLTWGLSILLLSTISILGRCAIRHEWILQKRWTTLIRWDSRDAEAWIGWAGSQSELRYVIAGRTQAVMLAPEDPYYREMLAAALEATHQREAYALALEHYQTALILAPFRAPNALAIGRIWVVLGQPHKALPWFQKALSIEPNYWECDLWIARCLALQGEKEKSLRILRNLRKRHEMHLVWLEKSLPDLGPQPFPTLYQSTILAYDDRVVLDEMHHLFRKSVRVVPFIQSGESV